MSEPAIIERRSEDAINLARILYAAHGVTFFFSLGLLSVVPLIINYAKRPDAQGTIAYSHHGWMIRSFWWYALWMVIGAMLAVTVIGLPLAYAVWGVAWLWKAYRLIRGFVDLNNKRAAPG
ncbi:MAG TPA: hypothetical protein VGC21_05965 [Telluria sp.]|jgi:uncharacterized membrane protein